MWQPKIAATSPWRPIVSLAKTGLVLAGRPAPAPQHLLLVARSPLLLRMKRSIEERLCKKDGSSEITSKISSRFLVGHLLQIEAYTCKSIDPNRSIYEIATLGNVFLTPRTSVYP